MNSDNYRSDLEQIHDNIGELIDPRTHLEPFTVLRGKTPYTSQHKSSVPSLIDQLTAAFVRGSNDQNDSRSAFGSRPSAALEAIDILMRIDTEAGNWVDAHGGTIRKDTADNLRWLNGHAPSLTAEEIHDLHLDVRGWMTWARITTGWEVPPFRPANSCPLCAQRGGLRIRVGEGIAQGLCVHCGEHWTPETVGLLAEHIRSENNEDDLEETA